jgi:tRNA nucleotidyltransferase/poly(A) polymerase
MFTTDILDAKSRGGAGVVGSLDLSQQVSYFTSLFQRSTSNSNTNLINNSKLSSSTTVSFSTNANDNNPQSSGNNNNSGSNQSNTNNNKPQIQLTPDEQELFDLLTQVIKSTNIKSTLRVAGGWVRDKLLATDEFQRRGSSGNSAVENNMSQSSGSYSGGSGLVDRLTSKYRGPSLGRQGTKLIGLPKGVGSSTSNTSQSSLSLIDLKDVPVDIDIALDDMLGREFADHLNEWLTQHGQETISVGVVLKNPEKSKHLETATMKVGKFWIDFVNLRAEEYTEDSRIPDLMRIGTAEEDAFRRDLTINALFYNINTGEVEDFTGKGFGDLKKGVVATPLPALTTLLDDPLRVLRSVRFAARLRFTIEESLREAATNEKVRIALAQKVARERIGAEVDLMLRSQDPVGAMRLLINLNLAGTVFPIDDMKHHEHDIDLAKVVFTRGLNLLSTTHDHLVDCKVNVPIWCEKKRVTASANFGVNEVVLMEDEELRRKLWYASFLKPLRDESQMMKALDKEMITRRQGKKANRSVIMKLMVDELKRPVRDAETVEAIMKGADEFTHLLTSGCDLTATACLLGDVRVIKSGFGGDPDGITCLMGGKVVDCEAEKDPLWQGAMEYRLMVSKPLKRLGQLWRASIILSLSEQLAAIEGEEIQYTIEGDVVSLDDIHICFTTTFF